MADLPTRPILIRDGTVVATAVGVSDPSLTLVEFERGVGFLLATGYQADSFGARYYLEEVILWRTGDLLSETEQHKMVALGPNADMADTDPVTAKELELLSAHWQPAVFFLSETDRTSLLRHLKDHNPGHVLREAFNRAHGVPDLRPQVLKLKARWEDELSGFHVLAKRDPSKKQTVRITLPPKPGAGKTVRPETPPGGTTLSGEELDQLRKWLEEQKQNEPPEDPLPPKS